MLLCLSAASLLPCAGSNAIAGQQLAAQAPAVSVPPELKPNHINVAGVVRRVPHEICTDRSYDEEILKKVDERVRKNYFSEEPASKVWPPALERDRAKILASRNFIELFKSINGALSSLKSSHTEFATDNDEIFYFLHDLFGRFRANLRVKMDYVGFVTGPPRFADDCVRYVLDGSPAAKAGILVGDRILAVDGNGYIGVANFFGKSGKQVAIDLERNGVKEQVQLTPKKADDYLEYVSAIRKSVYTFTAGKHTCGYVHDWCGGQEAHNALEETIGDKLSNTDGLILDLRDGYGGNSLEDLDMFYRPAAGFAPFTMKSRDGKATTDHMYYDKPVVAIINDGARSGKELLAYSLKKTGRAKLVGLNTAGAVLGGRMFVLDKHCILYLAVTDCTIGGERLEGVGVAPDLVVADQTSGAGKAAQVEAAKDELAKLLEK